MTIEPRRPLEYYLSLDYPFQAIADEDGGYVVVFSDLPGSLTQADDLAELAVMAADAKAAWITTEYERGGDIPLPSYPQEYSGKFNLRLPKSLHRRLAEGAARDEVSLNQYVVGLLSEGVGLGEVLSTLRSIAGAQEQMRATLDELAVRVDALSSEQSTGHDEGAPVSSARAA
jgi:predicted HicB family RNase H-like nuclease